MGQRKRKSPLKPKDARTFDQICELPRDGFHARAWWFSLDVSRVTVCQQKSGEASTGMVHIPRREFDRLIRWYMTGRAR